MTSQAEQSQVMSGERINGRFELQGLALTDGFGDIAHALDHKTGKRVSLRSLASPTLAAAVRAEIKALGSFSHPNLLRVYGVVRAPDGLPMLVQAGVPSFTLDGYVEARNQGGRPLGLSGAYAILAPVCYALSALHESGPHGAVRPRSVWIGDDGRVQLADVALARAALAHGPSSLAPDVTAYLAPEVKQGQPPSVASDVFGVGSLLYVLLTGRSPTAEFALPSQVHGQATSAIDQVLLQALAADPRARQASVEALRAALQELMEGQAAAHEAPKGPDSIEIDVSLASMPPPRRATASIPVTMDIHGSEAPPDPGAAPRAGARVALDEPFRPSSEADPALAEAAQQRRSLGEIDLKDVLAKITEDDAPRWMVVKEGMDHGPFSGRQLVNMIVQGEAIGQHDLMNTDTGRRAKLSEFSEFQDFLQQYELRKFEQERAQALEKAETREKKSVLFKVGIGLSAVAVVAVAGVLYALTRTGADRAAIDDAELDMYKRGEVAISGSAGILPVPRSGGGRRASGARGGGALSYEEAMMQAVQLGSAAQGGGEQQLSAGTVAGVMNKHLNRLYRACVRSKVGKVSIDIAIAGSGQVLGVSVGAGDASFKRCIAEQVRSVRFPSFSAPRMGARYSFDT